MKACHPVLDLKLLLANIQLQENEMHKPGFYIFTRLEKHGKNKKYSFRTLQKYLVPAIKPAHLTARIVQHLIIQRKNCLKGERNPLFISSYLICFDWILGRKVGNDKVLPTEQVVTQ